MVLRKTQRTMISNSRFGRFCLALLFGTHWGLHSVMLNEAQAQ